jgi:hypothetical protein
MQLGFRVDGGVVGLGNAYDLHHLIVGSDEVAVYAPGLEVDRPALLVILLSRLWSICLGVGEDGSFEGGPTLDFEVSALRSQ